MRIRKWTSSKVKIKGRKVKKEQGGFFMATQIAATPILYGSEAKRVLSEVKVAPSSKAKENAKKLLEYFSKFTSEGE